MSLLLTLTFTLLSAVTEPTPATVRAIHVQGNTRTRSYIIRNEIETRVGEPYSAARWTADVQRVRDLGIFWTTSATSATTAGGLHLFVNVEEKWTLIPLFGFNRTEDVTEWSGGLAESNLLGRNLKLAVAFSRKQGGNTYAIYHDADRVGKSALYYAFDLAQTDDLLTVYNQNERSRAEPEGFYEARGSRIITEVGLRLDPGGIDTLGLYSESRISRYELLDHTPEQRETNLHTGFVAPPAKIVHRLGIHLKAGKLHYQDYLYRGRTLNVYVAGAMRVQGEPRFYSRSAAEYRRFWILFRRHNAGVRGYATTTDSRRFEERATLGGLGEIRGFPMDRFAGRHAWFANAEYRYPALDNRYILMQSTLFADAGSAWSGPLLSRHGITRGAASGGAGLRFIVKPVISMMVRLDYAWTVLPYRSRGFALGITQFF